MSCTSGALQAVTLLHTRSDVNDADTNSNCVVGAHTLIAVHVPEVVFKYDTHTLHTSRSTLGSVVKHHG